MNWSDIFNAHNILLFLSGVVGVQIASFVAKFIDGAGSAWVLTEIKKLQDMVETSSAGKIMSQFHAEQALFSMVENAVPVVFHELSTDVQAALTSGNLQSVDWRKIGTAVWAKIRDQATSGANNYLAQSAYSDGALLCADLSQVIFSKLHMNIAIANANPATPALAATANPLPPVTVVPLAAVVPPVAP